VEHAANPWSLSLNLQLWEDRRTSLGGKIAQQAMQSKSGSRLKQSKAGKASSAGPAVQSTLDCGSLLPLSAMVACCHGFPRNHSPSPQAISSY